MGKSPSPMPVQKVTIGALAGAITTIALCLLRTSAHIVVSADVAGALTIVVTFIASYLTPPECPQGGAAGDGGATGTALANGAAPGAGWGSGPQALLVSGEAVWLVQADRLEGQFAVREVMAVLAAERLRRPARRRPPHPDRPAIDRQGGTLEGGGCQRRCANSSTFHRKCE
jgi:hypothetical protein